MGKTLQFLVIIATVFLVGCSEEDLFHRQVVSYDIKGDTDVSCDPKAARKPFPGADLLGHCFNLLKPGSPLSDECLKVLMEVSIDCYQWIPNGYNVQRTRVFSSSIQHKIARSLLELSHESQFGISASIAVNAMGVGGSASFEHKKGQKQKQSTSSRREYMLAFKEQRDNAAEMSLAFPPEVSDQVQEIMDELEEELDALMGSRCGNYSAFEDRDHKVARAVEKALRKLMRFGTHIILQANIGSREELVS